MTLEETLAKAEELLQEAYIKASMRIYCDFEAGDQQVANLAKLIEEVEACREAFEEIE